MKELKEQLKREAVEKHGKIYPSGDRKVLDDCFTISENKILFWFNLDNETTKVLIREIHN
jgi:hypothetical protein